MATMKEGQRAKDVFKSQEDFEEYIKSAKDNASNAYEEEFAASVWEKFQVYGWNMYWSERQDELLRKIAAED